MAGDISRSSFQALNANTGVRMQQGRVQLDADWNEQLDIQAYRERTLATDLLLSAAPAGDPGFAVTAPNGALAIGPGRMYVEGILCENFQTYQAFAGAPASSPPPQNEPPNPGMEAVFGGQEAFLTLAQRVDFAQMAKQSLLPQLDLSAKSEAASSGKTFYMAKASYGKHPISYVPGYVNGGFNTSAAQAQPSNAPAAPTIAPGRWAVYLDVWEREITALEDPSIREVALGGPDTTTRTRVVWQVKLAIPQVDGCPASIASLVEPKVKPFLSARAAASDTSANPCVIPATAGYRSLENQLYRVEIHQGGDASSATFKWSRDNATVVAGWQSGNGADGLAVTSLGRDGVLAFAAGQWVELTDDTQEFAGTPGTLAQLTQAQLVGQVPTLSVATATAGGSTTFSDFPSTPKVRRWDHAADSGTTLKKGAIPVQEGTWIALENGVEVFFQIGGGYTPGDFWLIPARTATSASQPTVLWPVDPVSGAPIPQARQGIVHHYTALATADFDGHTWTVLSDCRRIFSPLSSVATQILSVQTLEAPPRPVGPGAILPPLGLLTGLQIACSGNVRPDLLNVSNVTIGIDLPATDERFAETADPGAQVAAALQCKALGNLSVTSGNLINWVPYPSTRRYFFTRLAAFGATTMGQGLAELTIRLQTASIAGAPTASPLDVFTLSAWVAPYLDPTVFPGTVFAKPFGVLGPDVFGNYLITGVMTHTAFQAMQELPALDVPGNKLYALPVQMYDGAEGLVYAYVPSPRERVGDFGAFGEPITDPNTGGHMPGNQIPPGLWPNSKEPGFFAWRIRGFVPTQSAYGYGYGYGYPGGSAVGGELI